MTKATMVPSEMAPRNYARETLLWPLPRSKVHYTYASRLNRNEFNVGFNIVRELWHKRLCDMNPKRMHMVAEKVLLPNVKKVHLDKCPDCLVGK